MSEKTLKDNIEQHAKGEVKEKNLWRKIAKYAKKIGVKSVYSALLMFYAYRRKDTPKWAKRIITGALAYFIAPLDLIPDLTPFLGFTDDLGILGFGMVAVAAYINDEVRAKSREQLTKWFGDYDEKELKEVDDKL